jgi:diguanylate cyclase (GGDEF)-like protein/PAS domain S-box-containing protein
LNDWRDNFNQQNMKPRPDLNSNPLSSTFVVAAAFLGALAAASVLIWNSEQYRLQKEHLVAHGLAGDHAHALQVGIERVLSANYALAALVREGGGNIHDFEGVAKEMLPFYPGASALALSPGGVIHISVPVTENLKSIGLDQFRDPVQHQEALHARHTGRMTLAGPFELAQGGLGVVGRLPVFLNDGNGRAFFWGFTNVVIRIADVLKPAGLPDLAARGYVYELWRINPNTGQKQTIAASSPSAVAGPIVHDVQVPNATWHLSLAPAKGWSDPAGLLFKGALGLLFSTLAGGLARLVMQLRSHKRRLESEVAERVREICVSQNQLQTILAALPDLLFEADLEGRIHDYHSPRTELLAVPPEVFLGLRFEDFIPPEAAATCMSALYEANEKGISKGKQYALELASGKCWFELSVSRKPCESGDMPHFIILARDITDRKSSEEAVRERDARYRLMFQANPLPMWVYDLRSLRFLAVNDAAIGHYGYSAEEFLSMTIEDIRPPEDVPLLQDALANKVRRGVDKSGIWRHRKRDGTLIDVEIASHRLGFGNVDAVMVLAHDVTDRLKAEAHLRLAARIFEQSTEGFVITDAGNNIVMINQAFSAITGFSEADVIGRNPRILASGLHDRDFFEAMWKAVNTEGHWQGELWNRRKDGTVYPEWLIISRLLDDKGKVIHYIGIFNDISQYKAAQEDIQRLAHFDPLTGLPNRFLLHDRVNQAISKAKRNRDPLAFLFVDLDHFKNINDSLGHRIGDELLSLVAQRMKSLVREQDTVSRQGGDEFILILPDTNAEGAAYTARRLLEFLAQPYLLYRYELVVTPSIGIAVYPDDGENFEALAQCADVAMYRAKSEGRNGYCFFTAEMHENSMRRLHLQNALHRALELGQLQLFYQPQVALQTGRVIGVEALLRWQHPEWGMIPPAEFIPIAEDCGLIIQVGEWVLRSAVRQLKAWMDRGLAPVTMAVNLSAVQFRQSGLPALVAQILLEEHMPPHLLELELTERIAMSNAPGAIAVMDKLHTCGIRMSLDDFGTGYSSMSYLKRFKVYKLKIDRSFISDVTQNPEDKAIVLAIIGLSRNLGFRTIAEGVETEEQLAFLREHGCDEVQGYYFSRPLAAVELEEFLRGHGGQGIK